MSNQSVTAVPHKHAEAIKAWADGAQIECMDRGAWVECPGPTWKEYAEYRVKPEPPAKVYPVTQMTLEQIMDVVRETPGQYRESYIAIANAAIRHAIDAGQVVEKAAP